MGILNTKEPGIAPKFSTKSNRSPRGYIDDHRYRQESNSNENAKCGEVCIITFYTRIISLGFLFYDLLKVKMKENHGDF